LQLAERFSERSKSRTIKQRMLKSKKSKQKLLKKNKSLLNLKKNKSLLKLKAVQESQHCWHCWTSAMLLGESCAQNPRRSRQNLLLMRRQLRGR